MECLDIPIDHRLRTVIRRNTPRSSGSKLGNHVRVLRKFGETLFFGDSPHPAAAINFACDLAGPDTTGGLVVILDQPKASQQFCDGTMAEIEACNTLRAVRDLVLAVSKHCFTIDEISVFNAIPLITDKYDTEDEVFQSADETLLQMVAAKKPDTILSCFQTFSVNSEMRRLQSPGIGTHSPGATIIVDGTVTNKVNAFHPSYAVNYNPEYACFRQLLILEFAHAFGVWSDNWEEGKWMYQLRSKCATQAGILFKATQTQPQDERYGPTSWAKRLGPIDCLFRKWSFFALFSRCKEHIAYKVVVDSGMTWQLCDAGLFLLNVASRGGDAQRDGICLETQKMFVSWVSRLCRADAPNRLNKEHARGMYQLNFLDDQDLTSKTPNGRRLRTILIRFMQDMNMSFAPTFMGVVRSIQAQSDAFLRFAKSLENVLELMGPPEISVEDLIRQLPSS